MKSLKEHNNAGLSNYYELAKLMEPHPNGIECPQCKGELWDSRPGIVLTSLPPQKNVHCPSCGYSSYAIL